MFEVIRYIFDTNWDVKLYYNQNHLMNELVEQEFSVHEIAMAMNWFNPIIDSGNHKNYSITSNSIRGLDYAEVKYLPKQIVENIFQQEKLKFINAFQRDILIDRLSLLAQEEINEAEIQEMLDNLVWHFNAYTFGLPAKNALINPTAWTTNFTIH